MLRVEIHESANSVSLKLEGRFTGADAENTRTLIRRCREGMRLVVDHAEGERADFVRGHGVFETEDTDRA